MTNAETPPPTTASAIEQTLQQAIAHYHAGRLQDAGELYRDILQSNPGHPEANHNMGVLAVQMGQPAAGLPYFEAALDADPARGQYWLNYIDALFQAGQTEGARQVLALAQQNGLEGDGVEALALRLNGGAQVAEPTASRSGQKAAKGKQGKKNAVYEGKTPSPQEIDALIALFNGGRLAEAAAQARAMTEQFPTHWVGWKMLGVVLQQMGRNADALLPLQKAAALLPGDTETHNNLGIVLQGLGRLEEAQASYRRALKIKPNYAQAHSNLGSTFQSMERLAEAEASYRRAIQIDPAYAKAHSNLGAVLQAQGKLEEAEASYRRALQVRPDYAEAHFNLGITLKELGRLDEAEASYRKALQVNPNYAEAHNNLGIVLHKFGRLGEAEASCRQALRIDPGYAEAQRNLGATLYKLDRLNEAEASYREALRINPDCAEAYNNLGVTLQQLGRSGEAETSYREALRINPDYAEAHNNLGAALHKLDRSNEAEASCRQALRLKPDYAEAYVNLGAALHGLERLNEAGTAYRQALQLNPDCAEAHNNLGVILQQLGRPGEAEASFRQALRIKPDYAEAQGNLLFIYNFMPDRDQITILAEARHYSELVAQQAHPFEGWSNTRDPARRLRVGLVSGDMRAHPVGYFLEGMLAALRAHAADRLEIYAYSNRLCADTVTERIRACCHGWHTVPALSDKLLAEQIYDDGIDVLIDLSGHTAYNRLPVFAWKPAPVQATWLGYLATTGVAAMDYLIADPWTLPETEEIHFTEKIWRMPATYLYHRPLDADEQVAPLPALTNGYVTFGCFNNLVKVHDDVVALWAKILHAVSGSRLLIKATLFREISVRRGTQERFAAHGITADRLILMDIVPRTEYLTPYHRVDIALDPFPYPGITTSIESLWMGVPVLTMSGESFLSRQGVGILMNAGLPEWIAVDADDYVARAVAHAGDLPRLAKLRGGLRQQALASPIFDAPRFAGDFEAALRGMWQAWCEGHPRRAASGAVVCGQA